ncbi:Protein FMO-2, partial [Aphelenchoides avenae]
AHPTVNDELPNRLASGTIVVKPNIKSFTEKGVIFDDGTHTGPIDEVIMSTGYSFEFPLAEGGRLIPVVENNVMLYQYPLGSIMPISEMQARFFFDALIGHTKLPSKTQMQQDIMRKRDEMRRRYVASRRHTIQVDYDTYMDELADMMGCHPCPLSYLLTDPLLAYRLIFGANAPYVFRLRGPHAWSGARDAILGIDTRVCQGMSQTQPPSRVNEKSGLEPSVIWLVAAITVFITLCLVFWFF